MMGAIVRHCVGNILCRWSNFSSSSRDHSVFLMDGSSHSYHLALHSLALFLTSSEDILLHWFSPYFMTADFNISSSEFFQIPPLTIYLIRYFFCLLIYTVLFNIILLILTLSIVIIFDFSLHIPSVQILFVSLFYNFFMLRKSKFN